MKIKTLTNLVFANIRSRKKVYLAMGMVIFIVSTLFICGQNIYTNQYHSKKAIYQAEYGTWFDLYINTNQQSFEESIKTNYSENTDLTYGFIHMYGNTNNLESLGYVESDDYQKCGIHIIEGNQEKSVSPHKGRINIIVDEKFFDTYQLPRSINQEVTFEYKNYQKEFIKLKAYIVGIYEMKDEVVAKKNFPTILLCQPWKDSISRVNAFVNRSIDTENIVYTSSVRNVKGYDSGVLGSYYETVAILNFMIVCIGIGSIVILGVTYSSLKSKSKDLTLLRGIGATKKQLLLMILFECLIVYGIAQILSILCSGGICYLIMNIIFKEFYINPILYLDVIMIGSVCSLFMAFVGFFIPVSYTMKNALSGTFDHQNFQYFQVRYRKLNKQNTTQLAYRSLTSKKRFTSILILATMIPIYCFAQLQNAISINEEENQRFLSGEISNLEKYITLWDTEIEIDSHVVTQLKKYSQNIQTSPIYILDRDSILLKEYDQNALSQITFDHYLSVVDQNYIKTIDSSKYRGKFPKNDNEVFLTHPVFGVYKEGDTELKEVRYDIGDTITVKGKKLEVVGYMMPNSYQKVEDYSIYEYTTNYLMENSLYVNASAYQTITQQSADKMRYLKVFINDENYQDVSFIMTQYSFQIGTRLRDSAQGIEDLVNGFQELNKQKVQDAFLMSIEMTCGALIIYAFMNYYDTMSHKKDYALLKILGATRLDLIIIQLKKAFMITSLSSLITFIFLAVDFNPQTLLYIGYILLSFIPIFTTMSLMYIIPILFLIKQDPLQILDIED